MPELGANTRARVIRRDWFGRALPQMLSRFIYLRLLAGDQQTDLQLRARSNNWRVEREALVHYRLLSDNQNIAIANGMMTIML